MPNNEWCDVLGIEVPDLGVVKDHRDANVSARLYVALLERGAPMTLPEVAQRFEEVGIATADKALRSLKRCRPAAPPAYLDGEHYGLDPYDPEIELWVFRLGLTPPRKPLGPPPKPEPLPGDDVPLTLEELREAWAEDSLRAWSAQRVVLAVLEAHGGQPMTPDEVTAFVRAASERYPLISDPKSLRRKNSLIRVGDDGRWGSRPNIEDTLRGVRKAVRARLEMVRRDRWKGRDPATQRARIEASKREDAAKERALTKMSRALFVAYPPEKPRVVARFDVERQVIDTFVDEPMDRTYDVLAAENVRALMRALEIDVAGKRLADLGPPQQGTSFDDGRMLPLSTALLVQSSCRIRRPFTDPKKLADHLARGALAKVRRCLEADLQSLYALYEYVQLHGLIRVRSGNLDVQIPASWSHHADPTARLFRIMDRALHGRRALQVVLGKAPPWKDPWSKAIPVTVVQSGYRSFLMHPDGGVIEPCEVQRARLAM